MNIQSPRSITTRNIRVQRVSSFLSALLFTIPIWIVYYQQRITIEQISFLVALQAVIQLVFELPTGAFADMVGKRRSMIICYGTLVVMNIVILFSQHFWQLAIAAVLYGISESLLSGSQEALMYDSAKQDGRESEFGKIQANNSFWYQIALGLGTVTGGFLYTVSPFVPFLLCAIAALGATVVSFWFIEPSIDTQKFTARNYLYHIRDGVKEAFHSKAAALISIFYIAVAGITWPNQLYFNSFMMVELGFTPFMMGFIIGFFRFFNVFVLRAILNNKHIFTRNRSILIFPLMMTICFLPGIFFRGWFALPFVMGALMMGTARWILLTPYTNAMFSSRYRATAISALSMIIGLIYIGLTGMSGPIIAAYGVRMIYTILGILTLVTVLPLSVILVRNQKTVL
ncbi:MAG: MFS transporter [Candidatus Gottesmanbacteria bacterium]|nr:MFS transporter [Candidatus Gottesmanbacteria bacterium]